MEVHWTKSDKYCFFCDKQIKSVNSALGYTQKMTEDALIGSEIRHNNDDFLRNYQYHEFIHEQIKQDKLCKSLKWENTSKIIGVN